MALSLFQFLDLLLSDLMSTSLFHQIYILSLICWLINNSINANKEFPQKCGFLWKSIQNEPEGSGGGGSSCLIPAQLFACGVFRRPPGFFECCLHLLLFHPWECRSQLIVAAAEWSREGGPGFCSQAVCASPL